MRSLVVLAVLLGMGCGFLPGRRSNPPPDPDGIAPFSDQGSVELCQEGTRLVPSGPPVTGFCVPEDGAAQRSCETDTQCQSRERCLCGRCVVPFCTETTDCRADQTCVITSNRCGFSCAVDEDCAGGARCDRGLCAPPCRADDECQTGESCSTLRGVCVSNPCSSATQCGSDEHCDAQRTHRDLHEPTALWEGDGLVLFLEDRAAGTILRATSDDPGRFEVDPRPVLEDARAPAILAVADRRFLYHATADRSALVRTTLEGDVVVERVTLLEPEEPWEGSWLDAPVAALADGRVFVAYAAEGGIGLAVEDGDGLRRLGRAGADGPSVSPGDLEDALLWRAMQQVGSPMLVADETALGEPRLRLWVTGRGAEASATVLGDEVVRPPINDSIGYLESRDDGATFTPSPFNPTFARVAELGGYKGEAEPWILQSDGGYLLFFVGASVADGTFEGLGLATTR